MVWLLLTLAGLTLTLVAVRTGAQLGTASAPFLGFYRVSLGVATLLAPAVAAVVVAAVRDGLLERIRFGAVLALSYVGALAWALALALVEGAAGLTRSLRSANNYLTDVPRVGDDPWEYLRGFVAHAAEHSTAARGHPPGPVLLLWGLERLGLTDRLTLGLLIAAVGALLTPLVLSAVRGVCGEVPARRYAPVLILAPYAVWIAVSVDVVVRSSGPSRLSWGYAPALPPAPGSAPPPGPWPVASSSESRRCSPTPRRGWACRRCVSTSPAGGRR